MLRRTAKDDSEVLRGGSAILLQSGLNVLSLGFAVFGKDLKLVICNKAFGDLRGFPQALCRYGTDIAELYRFNAQRGDYGPGDIEEHVSSRVERARRFEPYDLEYELATGRILNIAYRPIARDGLLVSLVDVTDRKHAEMELEQKTKILEITLENMGQGISLVDGELKVIAFNQKFLELLEFPPERFKLGYHLAEAFRYNAERGEYGPGDVEQQVEERLELARGFKAHRFERTRPDGTVFEIQGAPLPDKAGFVSTYTDITERKQAEQALLAANQQIEDANKLVIEKNQALESVSAKLSKYLSPQICNSIFSGEQSAEIASKRKKLTIFFADIAGFTETADRLESEELTQLVNRYLTEMSQIALGYGATIDKFVGDAILLFFGDPETKGVNEDAVSCVKMAIAMRKRMLELGDIWREAGIEKPWQVRMGIHTGFTTVGNFGSEDRMDYTIIGGAVNTAARLESIATPGEILISYETLAHVKDQILCTDHGEIDVKGIAYPVATYQVEDTYEDLGKARNYIREDQPNIHLDLDLDAMSEDDRKAAATILRRGLKLLSTQSKPPPRIPRLKSRVSRKKQT